MKNDGLEPISRFRLDLQDALIESIHRRGWSNIDVAYKLGMVQIRTCVPGYPFKVLHSISLHVFEDRTLSDNEFTLLVETSLNRARSNLEINYARKRTKYLLNTFFPDV